jgi:hypothetical protein
MWNWTRRFTAAFAVLALASAPALAALPSAAVVSASDDTEHVSQTVKLDPGGTLRLRNFSGRVTISAGSRPEVVIDAIRRAPRERLNRIKLDIHTEGSTVVVDANHREHRDWWFDSGRDSVVETEFDIKVPAQTNLDLHVFSSPVEVTGVEGSHNVRTFSARLRLDDVTGSVQAHSFSGPVEIRTKTWQPNQAINVRTFSGSIDVHIPEGARGSVSFDSFSGHLTSGMPLTLSSTSRRRLRAKLGDGGDGSLLLRTFSGNVRIDR